MSCVFFRVEGVPDLKHQTERQEMREVGALNIVEVFEQHQSESADQGRSAFRIKGKQNDASKTEPHPQPSTEPPDKPFNVGAKR